MATRLFNDGEVVELLMERPLDMLVDDLINQLNHDQIINLIKLLDAGMEDWDATEELRDYFVEEYKKADHEETLEKETPVVSDVQGSQNARCQPMEG